MVVCYLYGSWLVGLEMLGHGFALGWGGEARCHFEGEGGGKCKMRKGETNHYGR